MRTLLCVAVLLVCSVGFGQDKNTEYIHEAVAATIDLSSDMGKIAPAQHKRIYYQTRDRAPQQHKIALTYEVLAVERGGEFGDRALVSRAAELPEQLPQDLLYSRYIPLAVFTKAEADSLDVGATIVATGLLGQNVWYEKRAQFVFFATHDGIGLHVLYLVGEKFALPD